MFFAILALSFIQNVSFTMISRSKNRTHIAYPTICIVLSNVIWFLALHQLVTRELALCLVLPYIIGTVTGAITGATISKEIATAIDGVADWRE